MTIKAKKENIEKPHSAAELNEHVQLLMSEQEWLSAINLIKKFPQFTESSIELLWSLGWSYFKLEKYLDARKHLLRAYKLSSEQPPLRRVCIGALGSVYIKLKNYRRAEANFRKILGERDSTLSRMSLALALHAQGKKDEAERIHVEGIMLQPNIYERYKSYGAFLSDVGRRDDALVTYKKGRAIRAQKRGRNKE